MVESHQIQRAAEVLEAPPTALTTMPVMEVIMAESHLSKPHSNFIDLTDQRFGKLTVLRLVERGKYSRWECRCDCGATKTIMGQSLRSGATSSCGGCLKERHGSYKTGEYYVWAGMKARCLRPQHDFYENYGGRGIKVCSRWRDSFSAFLSDAGPRPSPKHTLDRIDVNGHYSCGKCEECIANEWPANCRWATSKEQLRNTRTNRLIPFEGQTVTIAEAAERLGMEYETLRCRIARGWSMEDALLMPVDRRQRRFGKGTKHHGK